MTVLGFKKKQKKHFLPTPLTLARAWLKEISTKVTMIQQLILFMKHDIKGSYDKITSNQTIQH